MNYEPNPASRKPHALTRTFPPRDSAPFVQETIRRSLGRIALRNSTSIMANSTARRALSSDAQHGPSASYHGIGGHCYLCGRNSMYGCSSGYGGWTFPDFNFGLVDLGIVLRFEVELHGGFCDVHSNTPYSVTLGGVTVTSDDCPYECRCSRCTLCTAMSPTFDDGIPGWDWGINTFAPTVASSQALCADHWEIVVYYRIHPPSPPAPPAPPPAPPSPPAPPAPPPPVLTSTGPCEVEIGEETWCVNSANYPSNYNNNEQCTITKFPNGVPITVRASARGPAKFAPRLDPPSRTAALPRSIHRIPCVCSFPDCSF